MVEEGGVGKSSLLLPFEDETTGLLCLFFSYILLAGELRFFIIIWQLLFYIFGQFLVVSDKSVNQAPVTPICLETKVPLFINFQVSLNSIPISIKLQKYYQTGLV